MTDKELLELAAKAAGVELEDERIWVHAKEGMGGSWEKWNPLTDDGDALRLAVKLNLDIHHNMNEEPFVSVWCSPEMKYINIEYGEDRFADTRRAIVRAAASIGENK